MKVRCRIQKVQSVPGLLASIVVLKVSFYWASVGHILVLRVRQWFLKFNCRFSAMWV